MFLGARLAAVAADQWLAAVAGIVWREWAGFRGRHGQIVEVPDERDTTGLHNAFARIARVSPPPSGHVDAGLLLAAHAALSVLDELRAAHAARADDREDAAVPQDNHATP